MQLPSEPRITRYESTDSTSERAFAAIAGGSAKHGDVHWADFQTRGRGRLGRQWQAQGGEGLLFSIVLFPEPPGPKPTELTVATCLAVWDAVRELGLSEARLKWPNDVLVGDSKLCGILIETRGLDPERPHFVVGIGVNVGQAEFPRELTDERPVTSFRAQDVRVEAERVLELIWKKLRLRLRLAESGAPLFADYTRALKLEGEVVLKTASTEVRGELVAVDSEAGVRIRTSGGELVDTQLEFVRSLLRDE